MKVDEYRTMDRLTVRQRVHLLHSEPPDDIEETTLAFAPVGEGASVLDIGCGTGSFLARLSRREGAGRLLGLDISEAAVASVAARGIGALRGDVRRLPFGDGTFDVVFARHMLDHVDDVPRALRECRRVLRSSGRLAAVVNDGGQAPLLSGLLARTVRSHGVGTPPDALPAVDSASLPALMEDVFGNVRVKSVSGHLVFPDPEPLVEFGVSLLHFYGVPVDGADYPAVRDSVTREITREFRRTGSPWRDPKGYSISVATKE
jgi:SAM-dependent methyltransferase